MPVIDKRESQQVYVRSLPGGGYVSIEVRPVRSVLGQRRYLGELIVEQRLEASRREGHIAPAVAHVEGESIAAVLHELYPLAQSNTAVANSVLTRRKSIGK
ncbi:MAG TPA: hypothetical protein VJ867_03705 [Gemmatimonadaceae bacterium]|nr:hypothetical protein [Gemmatimonadaceae bacterium]